jgi:hypothetical protein
MANYYVYSGAAGAGTGADWANAFTTLAAALTADAAGDTIYVAHDHAETQAGNMTLATSGTAPLPCRILCVNRAGTVPPVAADLATTATVTTTSTGTITFTGFSYYYGIGFRCGTGATNAAITITASMVFEACSLHKLGTTANQGSIVASANRTIKFINTAVQFGNTGDGFTLDSPIIWSNTASAVTGATTPGTLFRGGTSAPYCEGVDFSALGVGKSLFAAATSKHLHVLKNCKLGASITVAATPSLRGAAVDVINCDSGATNTRNEKYAYPGTLTTETTVVRTGGASDGTTTYSHAIVTNANSNWQAPFEGLPFAIWNETTGSAVTLTMHGTWAGGAVPNNNEVWFDVEYPGSATFPISSFATGGLANVLSTATALTSAASETWGGGTTDFKQSISVTPLMKGWIIVTPKVAVASTTVYIDPKIVVT